MTQFEQAPPQVMDLVAEVKKEFQDLANANILILMDAKKHTYRGAITLARITKTNELMRCLTRCAAMPDGYDLIMYLDKAIWAKLDRKDRVRIVRHELRHVLVEDDSLGDAVYRLEPHDIEAFIPEFDEDPDHIGWLRRMARVAAQTHLTKPRDVLAALKPDPNQMGMFPDQNQPEPGSLAAEMVGFLGDVIEAAKTAVELGQVDDQGRPDRMAMSDHLGREVTPALWEQAVHFLDDSEFDVTVSAGGKVVELRREASGHA